MADGTAQSPFKVATLDDLQKVGSGIDGWDLDCHYIQTADIDASETADWNSGEGFVPIGTDDNFEGGYNGQHYKITGLTINRPDDDYQALFWRTIADAKVQKVHLVEANITGKGSTGGIVGDNWGIVSACSFNGDIVGNNRAGGIVGANSGSVEKCCSSGTMLVERFGAGIAGDSQYYIKDPKVSDCYSDMAITATQGYIAGLCISLTWHSIVENSYFAGTLSGHEAEYGVMGERATLAAGPDNFFDITKNPDAEAGYTTPATTAEMMDIETYLDAGWDICAIEDFDTSNPTTWYIDDGNDYPRLWHGNPTEDWRIERREKDGEAWSGWILLEAEAKIEPVDGELIYDDEADLIHNTTYQYRARDADDAEAEWLESGETYFGWAETGTEAGIAISVEGKGIKVSSAGAEAAISVSSEAGTGVKRAEAGAEAGMGVLASGAGTKTASGAGAEAGITADAEGSGLKVTSAGAETGIAVDAEAGAGVKVAPGGAAEAGAVISAEGKGVKLASGGAETAATVTPEGRGIKHQTAGAEAGIAICAEAGPGVKVALAGKEAGTSIAAAAGPGIKLAIAGIEAAVSIDPEGGGGLKIAYGGAVTGVTITPDPGGGVKIAFGGAEAGIEIYAEGAGEEVRAVLAVLRVPGAYDPDLRLRGAVYNPAPIRLEGVRLHGAKH